MSQIQCIPLGKGQTLGQGHRGTHVVCCEDVLTEVSDGCCRSTESAQPSFTEGKRRGPSPDITCKSGGVKGRREEVGMWGHSRHFQ